MSRPPEEPTETPSAMEGLLATLDLTQTGQNRFQGLSPQVGWQRVFGGQVIAQALMAACRTVEPDRHVHSLHAYFMRPGDPSVPIDYEAERMRDGRSFATRRVVASQHGQAIFALSASFQFDEDGFEHQIEMPDVPMPDTLPGEQEIRDSVLKHAPAGIRRYWQQPRPIEIRPVLLKRYFARDALEPVQDVWVRATGPVPNDRHMQAVVLAYMSDMTLLDTSLHAHGTSIFDPTLQVASIDHAMWFHRLFSFDDWLLYTQDSPSTSGSRGMNRGSLFNRQGQLIASVAQEGLIRKKANA